MSRLANRVKLPKLISKLKVAEILGEEMAHLAASPDFPKPWACLNNRPLYREDEILKLHTNEVQGQ